MWPADLATKCDVVFSMLIADAALESVFSSYISGKPKQGSVFIDCSTVYPDLAQKLEAQAAELGIAYLACPVFGRPDAALAGKVLVVASGDAAAKQKVSTCQSRHHASSFLIQIIAVFLSCDYKAFVNSTRLQVPHQ